jgi:photosystem II stability/assembly factor-like uncharacterized protein
MPRLPRAGHLGLGLILFAACSRPAPPAAPAWEWVNPRPQGNTLLAIHARAPDAAFAVGEGGTVLAYDGRAWTRAATDTDATLTDVAADRAGTYVVGAGGTVLVSGDGRRFVAQAHVDADLHGLWANGVNRLFAVGDGGAVFRSTNGGGAWTRVHTGVGVALHGIAGAYKGDQTLVAVGAGGTILVADGEGATWRAADSPVTHDLRRVRVLADGTIVAVGDAGTIVRGDKGAFRVVPSGTRETLLDVAGDGDVVWVTGLGGTLLRSRDGGRTFAREASGTDEALYAVGAAGGRAFVGGSFGTLLEAGPDGVRPAGDGPRALLLGLGGDRDDPWIVGASGVVLHGATPAAVASGTTAGLASVWARGDEAWIAGAQGTLLHGRAGTLARVPSGVTASLLGVAANGPTVAVVGAGGTILVSRDGGVTFQAPAAPAVDLADVWVADDGAVVAVGERGTIWRDGAVVASGTGAALAGMWGRGADVVVVGAAGTALRSADGGRTFAPVATGTRADLHGVWGEGPDDLTLVGDGGLVLRGRAGAFVVDRSGTANALRRVRGAWAVGAGGTILHRSAQKSR